MHTMSATDQLGHVYRQTDWAALVERATGEPPNPTELHAWLSQWATLFRIVHGRPPEITDYPKPVNQFFDRMAHAYCAPSFYRWRLAFIAKHRRLPIRDEVPGGYLGEINPSTKKAKWSEAARWARIKKAWESHVHGETYDRQKEMLQIAKSAPKEGGEFFAFCFGFDSGAIKRREPADMAAELMADQLDITKRQVYRLIAFGKNLDKPGI